MAASSLSRCAMLKQTTASRLALNGNIYAYSWYLNNVCEKWDTLVEDDYVSVMPLPYRKKMGVTYIFPPTITQQLGVFSHENISENISSRGINLPSFPTISKEEIAKITEPKFELAFEAEGVLIK
jgi:dTDP-4-amino-4,6-dideoxygalactose transaminase